jgi:hypothetical protein
MSTHIGKIARLPREVRDELNERLEAGEPGDSLLAWLNALPAVREALATRRRKAKPAAADGAGAWRITPQNLSYWRQGGYQEWVQQQERRELAQLAVDDAEELESDGGVRELGNQLSVLLLAEYAAAARAMRSKLTDPAERFEQLQTMLLTLAKVRQQDSVAGRLELEAERLEMEQDAHEWHSGEERAAHMGAMASLELCKRLETVRAMDHKQRANPSESK